MTNNDIQDQQIKKQAEMQKIVNEMSTHAMRLHDLMTPGMTVHIACHKNKAILVPNAKPDISHLIISKPVVFLGIQLT